MQANAAAIIVAAGAGSRMGGDVPKQYAMLGAQAVIAHSYAAFQSHAGIGRVIVVIGVGQEAMAREALRHMGSDVLLVTGGATRQKSVLAGLEVLATLDSFGAVLIHDAARPFLSHAVIDRLLVALQSHRAAIPVLPVVDTLAVRAQERLGAAVDRESLVRVQTPQAFHFQTILNAHRTQATASAVTDDASLMRVLGEDVGLVEGDVALEKITHSHDLLRAQRQLDASLSPRTGMGYDVHRLVPDRPLWLCGVEIPHDRGLAGHSDADVAIHALVDALLGALAEGDIGTHFPPSDAQWRGAPSHQFLSFAGNRVRARGGRISHVDLTIICEAPKIGPHREAIRNRIAECLDIATHRVSIKATTTEQLGFTGRREGIAAQALATVLLPDL
jgi:2-C-methyl-D-erythritol 4-phosphate cytidylyltransferase / 2-C-methyl-D-erythritol 2,4-cyclodiphosphate synthase